MADTTNNKQIVQQYWDAARRPRLGGNEGAADRRRALHRRRHAGPGGTGPDGVVGRVRIGLEPLQDYLHLPGTNMIAEGDLVMTEHTERWEFHTGEMIDHSFVSVTQLRDGKICRWHDYSNIPNITDNAPAWWIEHIMKAATGG